MGNCHSIESGSVQLSEKLDELIDENLLYMKAILLHFLSKNSLGAGLKLHSVYIKSNNYYDVCRKDRHRVLSKESVLRFKEYYQFEKTLAKEMSQLRSANQQLKKTFKALKSLMLVPKMSKILSFVQKLSVSEDYKVHEIENQYKELLESNRQIDKVIEEKTNWKNTSASEETLIKDICKTTTYLFSDKNHNITYFPPPSKKRKTQENNRPTTKKEEQTV